MIINLTKKASDISPMPISNNATKYFTVAETLDYPDFYHRLPNVAEDTNVAHQEPIFCVDDINNYILRHAG